MKTSIVCGDWLDIVHRISAAVMVPTCTRHLPCFLYRCRQHAGH